MVSGIILLLYSTGKVTHLCFLNWIRNELVQSRQILIIKAIAEGEEGKQTKREREERDKSEVT